MLACIQSKLMAIYIFFLIHYILWLKFYKKINRRNELFYRNISFIVLVLLVLLTFVHYSHCYINRNMSIGHSTVYFQNEYVRDRFRDHGRGNKLLMGIIDFFSANVRPKQLTRGLGQ